MATIYYIYGISGKSQALVTVKSAARNQIFYTKVLKTPDEMRKGLMHVKELAENSGMLFLFEKPQIANMWMKDTFIPLDMIFINERNEIIKIIENAKPNSLEVLSSDAYVAMVLEINGGIAKKHGIRVGDSITYEFTN